MHLESMVSRNTQLWRSLDMSFGQRVRTLRTQQGITAKELSERSGVPEKTIYRIEGDADSDPKLSTVVKLVQALRCSADEIMFDLDALGSTQRLQRLMVETSDTSKDNQDLVIRVVSNLNLADKLRHEIHRGDVDAWLEDGKETLEEMAERVDMDTETFEYFKKHPTTSGPPDDIGDNS